MVSSDLDASLDKLRIDKSRKRPSRRKRLKPLIAALLVLILGGGYLLYARAYAPVEVKIAKPERETRAAEGEPLLIASGYVIPRNKIDVSSKIVGWVDEMLVQEGQQVKEGEVLLRLVDDEYVAQVKQSEAQVAAAEARLKELRTGSRPEEIAAARAAVSSARANLDQSKLDLKRFQQLSKEAVVSQQELDKARTATDVAQANLESAKKNAELVEKGPRKEQIEAAEAQLRLAKANLDYAKTQLEYTVIRAPITGTILEKLADKGELVTNVNFGGTRGAKSSVVSMANLNDLQVEVDVNENDLPKVRTGQKSEIRMESNPDLVFKGTVDEIAPEADRQKGTVQVKVGIQNPRGLIRTEVNAQVTFLAGKPAALASTQSKLRVWIPAAAIAKRGNPDDSKATIYIAANGRAQARTLKLSQEGPRGIEVLDGLTGAEKIITQPLNKISNGRRIRVSQQ